jgi:lysophospholipase L1-like esterase
MTKTLAANRRSVILFFALVAMIAPFLAWQGAQGGERRAPSTLAPHGIVVVGDSITARYNNTPGDPMQGWWSIVGHRYDADVTTYAQSGSGYLRPGHRCTGNRFIDRQEAFTSQAPSLFIIEGGRNDWSTCVHGFYVPASDAVIAHAVDRYLSTLQTFLPHSTRIIVMGPPWGPLDPQDDVRVTRIIEAAAKQHKLQFISTAGALSSPDRVVDGIHPNLIGSRAIAQRVIHVLGP